MGLVSSFNMSDLIEEVVEAVHTGYKFQKRLSANFKIGSGNESKLFNSSKKSQASESLHAVPLAPEDQVTVILDINQQANCMFVSEAGAWRRLVMNLFGNALKYTDAGFIRVAVRVNVARTPEDPSHQTMVHLSVSDTGKGISEEYLKHRLYTPFAQEDNLSVGAGLGLSIVQQIVTALKGTVDIQSQVGVGTNVTVSIPLTTPDQPGSQSNTPTLSTIRSRCLGLNVCLVAFDTYTDIDDAPTGLLTVQAKRMLALKSSLTRSLTDWFGLRVVCASSLDVAAADIFVVEQTYFDRLRTEASRNADTSTLTKGPPLVVLCANEPPKILTSPGGPDLITYLPQP